MEKRSAQIIAVDLGEAHDFADLLLPGRAEAVHAVDDLGEAAELAQVVAPDLVFLSEAALGADPIAQLAVVGPAFPEAAPFVAVCLEAFQRTRIYLRPGPAREWVVTSPGGERLAPFVTALLERGDSIVRVELPASPALRNRLIDIGCNSLVKTAGGDRSIQTEVHVLGSKAVIRSTAFASGRIALSRRFPIGFITAPTEEARRLAEEIHRETAALAAAAG